MSVKPFYVIKSKADEGLMDHRFRPGAAHTVPGATGILYWTMSRESNDVYNDNQTVWAFDRHADAETFAHYATTLYPGYDFVVLTATMGYRAPAGPAKKFAVSDKGVLPV